MKKLESYIKTARTAKSTVPLLAPHELRSMVEHKANGSVQTSPEGTSSLPISITTMISSLLGALAVSAALWMSLGEPHNQSAQTSTGTQQTTGSEERSTQSARQERSVIMRSATQPAGDAQGQAQTSSVTATQSSSAQSFRPIMTISAEEAKALGLRINGDEVSGLMEERYVESEIPAGAKLLLNIKNYPLDVPNMIMRARCTVRPNESETDLQAYDGSWELQTPKGYSIYAAQYISEHDGAQSITMGTCDHSVYVRDLDLNRELQREFQQLSRELEKEVDAEFFAKPIIPVLKHPYKYAQYLVPLALDFSKGDDHKMAILYFVPTKAFVRCLSAKNQASLVWMADKLDELRLNLQYSGVSTAVEQEKIPTPSSIGGIEYLSLSADELRVLGIELKDETIRFRMDGFNDRVNPSAASASNTNAREVARQVKRQSVMRQALASEHHYDTSAAHILFRRDVSVGLGVQYTSDIQSYTGWDYNSPNPVSPVGFQAFGVDIVKSTKHEMPDVRQWINQEIVGNSPLLRDHSSDFVQPNSNGRLVNTGATIPVRIVIGSTERANPSTLMPLPGVDSNNYHVKAVDLYFVPNREFVERLPERYRSRLQQELQLLDQITKGELPISRACDILHQQKGASMLEICGAEGAELNALSVYPNPVQSGSFSCSFEAQNEGSYNISLYTLQGQLAHNLLQTSFRKGSNTITIDTHSIPSGIYVLSLSSAKGVQATKRIIIN